MSRSRIDAALVSAGLFESRAKARAAIEAGGGGGTDAGGLAPAGLPAAPALIVCDVSFISLRLVLPRVLPLAAAAADLVALVKPQFEAGPGRTKKGVVTDAAVREEVCAGMAA